LANFREFVELQCGSIFLITQIEGMAETVQVVHETFRSFLMNTKSCPLDLQITIDTAHGRIASTCLDFLATDKIDYQLPIYEYISTNWNYHLIHVKQGGYDQKILLNMYRFFHSEGFKQWVYHGLTENWNVADPLANETEIEDKALRDVRDWLIRYYNQGSEDTAPTDEFHLIISWRDSVVNEPSKLGEYVGRASTLIWVYEDLGTKGIAKAAFELAMRHYWRRDGRIDFNNRDDLEALIKTEFAALLTWAGNTKPKILLKQNLDIAKSTLQQWDEGLSYKSEITERTAEDLWKEIEHDDAKPSTLLPISFDSPPSSPVSCRKLAAAQISNGQLRDAVETMKRAVEYDTRDHMVWWELGNAHRAINEYRDAIVAYQKAISIRPREMSLYHHLAEVYHVIGNHAKSIETLERAVENNSDADGWAALGRSYGTALYEEKAVACFQRSIEINPAFAPGWKSLVDIYNIQGEFNRTVEAYEKESVANPMCSWVWSGLGDAYCAEGKLDAAIDAYKAALKRNSWDCWAWTCLGDAYRVNQRFDEAIQAFWVSIEKNPHDSWPWKGLAESYKAKGEIARAIAVYLKGIENMPIHYSLHISVARIFKEISHYYRAKESFQAALERCPAGKRLLVAFVNLPTSHLFSNYPVISINDNITSSLLWSSLGQTRRDLGDEAGALEIYDTVIQEYNSLINRGADNGLLWVYSSYLASRGFDPFEKRCNLPVEILWVLLGEAYKAKGDYTQALRSYHGALQLLPDNKWLWKSLGDLYNVCNDHGNEMEARKMAAQLDGHYSKTFYCY